jgi:magnesium-protoporphyrin IX monomethyl ester (oxidative) cyclase
MKILIVVAPFYYPNPYAMRTELLGVLYLAAALRAAGHGVEILDPTIGPPRKTTDKKYFYGIPQQEMEQKMRAAAADVVAISCHYAYSHLQAYELAVLAKRINPNVVTVMGGLFASLYKEKLLSDCPQLDHVLMGESEKSFPRLLSALASGDKASGLAQVDGAVCRQDGGVKLNEKKDFIECLDELPFPARDMVDIGRYMNTKTVLYGLGGRPALSLLTSRSCPHRCSFCNMWLIHGSRWRFRSPENVLAEIDEIVNRYHAGHVFIMDDNFTFDPQRAKQICEGIIRKGYRFRWNTPNGISVRGMDPELARLMKRAGCANVCLGIESGSEYIRHEVMCKHISNEQITHAVNCLHGAGIPVGGFITLGMPGEKEEHFLETLRFTRRLKLSFIGTTFAIPFFGTKLYNDLIQQGVIAGGFVPEMDNFNVPSFVTKDFTARELIGRRQRLLLGFYSHHAPQLAAEFLGGRLNWITPGMFKRVFVEKFMERN